MAGNLVVELSEHCNTEWQTRLLIGGFDPIKAAREPQVKNMQLSSNQLLAVVWVQGPLLPPPSDIHCHGD